MSSGHGPRQGVMAGVMYSGEVWKLDRAGGTAVPGDQASAHPWTWPPAGQCAGPHSPTLAGKSLGVQSITTGLRWVIARSECRLQRSAFHHFLSPTAAVPAHGSPAAHVRDTAMRLMVYTISQEIVSCLTDSR